MMKFASSLNVSTQYKLLTFDAYVFPHVHLVHPVFVSMSARDVWVSAVAIPRAPAPRDLSKSMPQPVVPQECHLSPGRYHFTLAALDFVAFARLFAKRP